MESLGHRSTSPFCGVFEAWRILINERRDYFLGIALLLVVVFLWTWSNFIVQVGRIPSAPCEAHRIASFFQDIFQGGYEKPFLYVAIRVVQSTAT